MALKDQLYIASVWTDADVQGTNDTGTPVTSAVLTNDGQEISDTYGLAISGRSGSTGTVTVSASTNNPYNGRVVTGVAMDDATEVTDVVPGVTIVFSSGTVNLDAATIVVGDPYGAFDASGVDAGVPTAGVRHRVVNTGTADVASATAKLLTQSIQVKKTGLVFDYIGPFAENAVEKTAGGGSSQIIPYALSVSAIAGSGPTKTCTLSVDGVAFTTDQILDLTTGVTQDGTLIKALGSSYPYRVVAGDLEGLEFSVDPNCANSNVANIMIFPSRYVQIASDTAGVEGTYGTTDVELTEAGQSAGVITPSGYAYFWARYVVPSSANNESNPYPTNIALSASLSTSAGWGD